MSQVLLLEQAVSLKSYNTLQVESQAAYLATVTSLDDVLTVLNDSTLTKYPRIVLGGGSNILITKDLEAVVIHNQWQGIKQLSETDEAVVVQVFGGVSWHELVVWSVDRNLGGIENLAMIPGTVGAAPVQNIGAYGQQFSDVVDEVFAIDLITGEQVVFTVDACEFGYRDSIFKHRDASYMVTSVTLRLQKHPKLDASYFSIGRKNDSLSERLKQLDKHQYTVQDVFEAVSAIRSEKLLDPRKDPTVGSFFKNPLVSRIKAEELTRIISHLQFYPADNLSYLEAHDEAFKRGDYVKLPAGRLIDERGWAGRRIGSVWMSAQWASIVTHDGTATGAEILSYLHLVQEDIMNAYGVSLEPEVVVL